MNTDNRASQIGILIIASSLSISDIDIVLDHAVSGVNQSYVNGTPVERKRKILSKWHSYLTETMNPEITTIKAAKS